MTDELKARSCSKGKTYKVFRYVVFHLLRDLLTEGKLHTILFHSIDNSD